MRNDFIQYCGQEQNNGHGVENMHHTQIEARRPIWIFFPEKIHHVNVRGLPVKSKWLLR